MEKSRAKRIDMKSRRMVDSFFFFNEHGCMCPSPTFGNKSSFGGIGKIKVDNEHPGWYHGCCGKAV